MDKTLTTDGRGQCPFPPSHRHSIQSIQRRERVRDSGTIEIINTHGPFKDGGSVIMVTNVGVFIINNRIRHKPRGQLCHMVRSRKGTYYLDDGLPYRVAEPLDDKVLAAQIAAFHGRHLRRPGRPSRSIPTPCGRAHIRS